MALSEQDIGRRIDFLGQVQEIGIKEKANGSLKRMIVFNDDFDRDNTFYAIAHERNSNIRLWSLGKWVEVKNAMVKACQWADGDLCLHVDDESSVLPK